MNYYSADVYAEVYELLSYMDKKEVMRIPVELLEDIKESRNKEYQSKIDIFDLYNENNLLPETIEVMAALGLKYMLPEKERDEIYKKYDKTYTDESNGEKGNSNTFDSYKYDDIFNNNKPTNNKIENNQIENNSIIETNNDSIFKKIKNFIKNLFKV